MKGISRIDSEKKKMHGWYVRVYGGGKTFSRYFSDHRFGGKENALKEAKAHWEKLSKETEQKFTDYSPRQNQPKYRRKPSRVNSSGVVGVHRCETVSRGRNVTYWVATWNEDGKPRDKTFYFSERNRSEEEAKRLAIEWRAKKMLELAGKEKKNGKSRSKAKSVTELKRWIPGLVIKEWSPDLHLGEQDIRREIKKLEPFNEKRIEELKAFLGIAIVHFDWEDIDYEFGRGIFKHDIRSRCFWNKKGIRTDIFINEEGRIVLSQGSEPDPFYLDRQNKNG